MKIWSFILILLLTYVGSVMPFNLSFIEMTLDKDMWFYLDLCIDFTFLIDIVINSFSAFYDEENILVYNNKKIFLRYLQSWFFIDLFASLPFGLLQFLMSADQESSYENYNEWIRLLRIPRMYRLLKITRVFKLLSFVKKSKMSKRL